MVNDHLCNLWKYWPSRSQEEVFKSVGPLHSRVLCLQIKRRFVDRIQVNTKANGHVRRYQNITVTSVQHGYNPLDSHPGIIMQRRASPVTYWTAERVFCNSQQSHAALWLGETSPRWTLTKYYSVRYQLSYQKLESKMLESLDVRKRLEPSANRHYWEMNQNKCL